MKVCRQSTASRPSSFCCTSSVRALSWRSSSSTGRPPFNLATTQASSRQRPGLGREVPPEIRDRVTVIRTLLRLGSDNEVYVSLKLRRAGSMGNPGRPFQHGHFEDRLGERSESFIGAWILLIGEQS